MDKSCCPGPEVESSRPEMVEEETVGTKILAGTPRRIAAYATAAPWFPPDAATTPGAGTSGVRRTQGSMTEWVASIAGRPMMVSIAPPRCIGDLDIG